VVFVFVQDGEITLSKGYGFADLETGISMNPTKTIVRIGSVSKLFVATAVMQLVERGRLDLHTDVNRYLDAFQIDDNYLESVTLAHLLTHTAGFDDYRSNTTDPIEIQPLGPYLAAHMPPRVIPTGGITSYSNHGYALAGYIVEKVSGIPFDQYVKEKILRPLGMYKSGYLLSPPLPAGLAVGYSYENGAFTPQPVDYDDDYPGGSMVSSADDMAKSLLAHLRDGCYGDACIMQRDTVTEMHQQQFTNHPQLPGWTYGFVEGFENSQRLIGHSGATLGFASALTLFPERDLGYSMAFNHECAGSSACSLIPRLREQFLDRFFPTEPTTLPAYTPETASDRLTGSYRHNRYYRSTVDKMTVLGRDLSVSATDGGIAVSGTEYVEVAPLLFQEVGDRARIAFRADSKGNITYMFRPDAYEKLAWYETSAVNQVLFDGWGWIWGAVVLTRLPTLLIRRRTRRPLTLFLQRADWLAVTVGILNATFLISLIDVFWVSFATMTALLVLPLVSTVLTGGMLIVTGSMWWRRIGTAAGRTYYSVVVLLALLFLWFLHFWNLLGFRFG
jgi:CubicO group peptidase (beta-lactamase class C family)